MGFWFDIYVATKDRSRVCIEQFLDAYVDLQSENLRHDFEVRLSDTDEFVQTQTLQNSIELGLTNPDTSFTLYLTSKGQEIKSVMVHFGKRDLLILGLSITEEIETGSNQFQAEQLLTCLKEEYKTTSGIIVVEVPPNELEDELEKKIKD